MKYFKHIKRKKPKYLNYMFNSYLAPPALYLLYRIIDVFLIIIKQKKKLQKTKTKKKLQKPKSKKKYKNEMYKILC